MTRLPVLLGAQLAAAAALLVGLTLAGWPPAAVWATPWGVPALVAFAGCIAGSLAWGRLAAQPDASEATIAEGRRTDLTETRNLVVAQLRQLDTERVKLHDEDYQREREVLLAVGAAAARALDEDSPMPPMEPTDPDATDPAAPPLADRLRALRDADPAAFDAAVASVGGAPAPAAAQGVLPEFWRGVVSTALLAAVIAALWSGAAGDARDRAPGASMTGGDQVMEGNARAAASAAQAAPDATLAALQERVKATPDDLDAWNQLTERAMSLQNMQTALDANARALEIAPNDRDARVFQAVLKAFIGRTDDALSALDTVLTEDPSHVRALVYGGLLRLRSDPARAAVLLERAVALDDDPMLRRALDQARASAAGGAGEPPAPAEDTVLVAGTLAVDGAAPPGAVLFLSLRDPAGGPPFAARKLPASAVPGPFQLTVADRLPMGGDRPLPASLVITARLDADGDPLTRPETDPTATDTVPVGSEGVSLTLRAAP